MYREQEPQSQWHLLHWLQSHWGALLVPPLPRLPLWFVSAPQKRTEWSAARVAAVYAAARCGRHSQSHSAASGGQQAAASRWWLPHRLQECLEGLLLGDDSGAALGCAVPRLLGGDWAPTGKKVLIEQGPSPAMYALRHQTSRTAINVRLRPNCCDKVCSTVMKTPADSLRNFTQHSFLGVWTRSFLMRFSCYLIFHDRLRMRRVSLVYKSAWAQSR